jgi:hypothetical protein
MTNQAKQIVYRYNGDTASEEVEQDLEGEIVVPQLDGIIHRHNKPWKAIYVVTETSSDGRMPLVRIFLTDLL